MVRTVALENRNYRMRRAPRAASGQQRLKVAAPEAEPPRWRPFDHSTALHVLEEEEEAAAEEEVNVPARRQRSDRAKAAFSLFVKSMSGRRPGRDFRFQR